MADRWGGVGCKPIFIEMRLFINPTPMGVRSLTFWQIYTLEDYLFLYSLISMGYSPHRRYIRAIISRNKKKVLPFSNDVMVCDNVTMFRFNRKWK